jgi:hypothetical protein
MVTVRRSAGALPRLRALACLDGGVHRRPIDRGCLTPAKRDQVAARGEWSAGAGPVHETALALGGLSYGKRLLHLATPNGSAEAMRKAPPTHPPQRGQRRRVREKRRAVARRRVRCLRAPPA